MAKIFELDPKTHGRWLESKKDIPQILALVESQCRACKLVDRLEVPLVTE